MKKDSVRVVDDKVLIITNGESSYYEMDPETTITIDSNGNIEWNGSYHPIDRDTYVDYVFSGVLSEFKIRQAWENREIKSPKVSRRIREATNVKEDNKLPKVRVSEEVFKKI